MTSKITLITPTCDRPFGVALAEKYVKHQTVQPHQWIVADGGQVPATLTMGQTHIRTPGPVGARNLANNILSAIPHVTGDIVVIVEDDDVYLPTHLERVYRILETQDVTGSTTLDYYNLRVRKYLQMKNIGSSLAQTAMRTNMLPVLERAAKTAHSNNSYGIDANFWLLAGCHHASPERTVVGMKGLPGTQGLGVGHRPNDGRPWISDPDFTKLREWLGDLAEPYIHANLLESTGR